MQPRKISNLQHDTQPVALGATGNHPATLVAVKGHAMNAPLKLAPTPGQILGPYYPPNPDLDADADLTRWPDADRRAKGPVMIVTGDLRDTWGAPLVGALIETWQCDAQGLYRHPEAPGSENVDPHFEGYGRCRTDDAGAWAFTMLRPTPYPGRAPHVHFKITAEGFAPLITQMYVAGETLNDEDFALAHAGQHRASLIVSLAATPNGPGDLAGRFGIVLAKP